MLELLLICVFTRKFDTVLEQLGICLSEPVYGLFHITDYKSVAAHMTEVVGIGYCLENYLLNIVDVLIFVDHNDPVKPARTYFLGKFSSFKAVFGFLHEQIFGHEFNVAEIHRVPLKLYVVRDLLDTPFQPAKCIKKLSCFFKIVTKMFF